MKCRKTMAAEIQTVDDDTEIEVEEITAEKIKNATDEECIDDLTDDTLDALAADINESIDDCATYREMWTRGVDGNQAVYSIRDSGVWTDSLASILRDAPETDGWYDDDLKEIAHMVLCTALRTTHPSGRWDRGLVLTGHHIIGRLVAEDE